MLNPLKKLLGQVQRHIALSLLVSNLLVLTAVWVAITYTDFDTNLIFLAVAGGGVLLAIILSLILTRLIGQPVTLLQQAILHLLPNEQNVESPDLDTLRVGQEYVASLMSKVYELANARVIPKEPEQRQIKLEASFVATNLPLPLFIISADSTITFVNTASATYLGLPSEELVGKNIYSVLDTSFPTEHTLDTWLTNARANSAVTTNSWQRVRLNSPEGPALKQFDLAAYYNQANPQGIETMLVIFDHTEQYSQDDQAVSYVALGVHELRTPLTLLRGYIEVFEEELADRLTPELKDFMYKMNASAQQLTAFVSNILNVARVDDDQLTLQLHEETWPDIIRTCADNLALRAKVRGITLEYSIAPNIPTVAVDRVSIYEVINNLIDNAIKYSGDSTHIRVTTYLNADGFVETTVQDFGVGIPTSVIPNLFSKFYRNHRNRAQIGGTGLGLYLSKAIVSAHGGQVWVKSKEGEGSTFGFTLQPYANLAEELKTSNNSEIVRGTHGWIKNHSLYRR